MSDFFIRTWKDLTFEKGGNLIINCSPSFKIKNHPLNKSIGKVLLRKGDTAYVYHTSKQRTSEHIPGNGLYCLGVVEEITMNSEINVPKCIKIQISKMNKIPLNDDSEPLKSVHKMTDFYRSLKSNCHEGYTIIPNEIANRLNEYMDD